MTWDEVVFWYMCGALIMVGIGRIVFRNSGNEKFKEFTFAEGLITCVFWPVGVLATLLGVVIGIINSIIKRFKNGA